MLDIHEDTTDSGHITANNSEISRHDLNVPKALAIAINDHNIDGIDFINIIRMALGHRIFIHRGKNKIQQVVMDDEESLSEDDEINDILNNLK